MSGLFYNLGRQLGRKAIPAIRKSKWIWDGLAGDEEAALRAEVSLGTQMAAELRTAVEMANEPETNRLLNDLCREMGARLRDKRRTFCCEVFRDRFANAIGVPGGFLFVSDSLLDLCERRRDELAFVLGHEMAHVVRRHTWDRMVNETVLRAVSVATARVGHLGGWLRQQGIPLLRSAYSREQEFEADELGLRLAIAAGFSATSAIEALQRFEVHQNTETSAGEYLSSHPPASQRVARLQSIARQPSTT